MTHDPDALNLCTPNAGCFAANTYVDIFRIKPGQLYFYLFAADNDDKLQFVETPDSASGGYNNWNYIEDSTNRFNYAWLPKGSQSECEAYQS